MKRPTNKQYRDTARRIHQKDGEIEIDNGAKISKADGNPDHGAYVAAWVWVYDSDVDSVKWKNEDY